MSRKDLVTALADAAAAITQQSVNQELAPLLPPAELAGVVPRMRAALARICDSLTQASTA